MVWRAPPGRGSGAASGSGRGSHPHPSPVGRRGLGGVPWCGGRPRGGVRGLHPVRVWGCHPHPSPAGRRGLGGPSRCEGRPGRGSGPVSGSGRGPIPTRHLWGVGASAEFRGVKGGPEGGSGACPRFGKGRGGESLPDSGAGTGPDRRAGKPFPTGVGDPARTGAWVPSGAWVGEGGHTGVASQLGRWSWQTGRVPVTSAHSGVGENPNRRLQSATRPPPAAG